MNSLKDRGHIRFGGGGRGSLGSFARNLVQAGVAVFANASVSVKVNFDIEIMQGIIRFRPYIYIHLKQTSRESL